MFETSFITNRAGLAALLTVVWGLVMAHYLKQYPYSHVFHHDVDSPVLALELSCNQGDIDAVLHRSPTDSQSASHKNPAVHNMAVLNWLDLVFIPLYTFSIWSFGRVFTTRTRLLAIGVAGAALFDYLEDVRIFRALAGHNPAICIPSLIKWGLLGAVFLVLGYILLKSESAVYTFPTKGLIAIAYLAAGMVILTDVALGRSIGYSHIALGVGIFSALLVVNVVGLLGHYLAIPEVKQIYVENFCQERKNIGSSTATAIRGERVRPADRVGE